MTEKIEFELTNNCICESYAEDGETLEKSYTCYGCFDDEKTNLFYEVITPWIEANNWTDSVPIVVKGSNVNWDKRSGFAPMVFDLKEIDVLIDAVSIDSQWILEFVLEGKDLKVVRRSHDELGASFEFQPVSERNE